MNRLLAVVIVVSLILSFTWMHVGGEEYSVDPVPLLTMLIDALSGIYSGNYGEALTVADTALGVNVAPDLSYLHYKAWGVIRDISYLLLEALDEGNASTETLYRFYRLKLEASGILADYASRLVNRIMDPPTRYRFEKTVESYLSDLDARLSELGLSILRIIQGSSRVVRFEIVAPDTVYAGGSLDVTLVFQDRVYVENISATLSSPSYMKHVPVRVGGYLDNYTIHIELPGTEEGYFTDTSSILGLYVAVYGLINDTLVYGSAYKSINVLAERAPVEITAPTRINPGSSLILTIVSQADTVLYSNLTITSTRGSEVYVNEPLTILPGENHYLVNTSWLPQGVYTVTLDINATGKYLRTVYSMGLAVLGSNIDVKHGAPGIILAPPFKALLYIELPGKPGEYVVTVRDGDRVIFNESRGPGLYSIEIPLRVIWIIEYRELVIEVIPVNESYSTSEATVGIVILNYASLITIVVLTLTLSSTSAEGLAYSLERLNKVLAAGSRLRRGGSATPHGKALYYKLVKLLSRYTRPPVPSETLREYYNRVVAALRRAPRSLLGFILLYEKYLYSREKPSQDELAGAYRRVEEEFK